MSRSNMLSIGQRVHVENRKYHGFGWGTVTALRPGPPVLYEVALEAEIWRKVPLVFTRDNLLNEEEFTAQELAR